MTLITKYGLICHFVILDHLFPNSEGLSHLSVNPTGVVKYMFSYTCPCET